MKKLIDELAEFLIDKSQNRPIIIHIDFIGLLNLSDNNQDRIEGFRQIILEIEQRGGDVFIPVYSYSFTKEEKVYDIQNSASDVGFVTDYLCKKDFSKRTFDPIFSYLVYSTSDRYRKYMEPNSYDTFSNDSLIAQLHQEDAFLCVLGCQLKMLTETHYIERTLDVAYRFDKTFSGTIIDHKGVSHDSSTVFYCRNMDDYPDERSNFKRYQDDILTTEVVKEWRFDDKLLIQAVGFDDFYSFLMEKFADDRFYLSINKNLKG